MSSPRMPGRKARPRVQVIRRLTGQQEQTERKPHLFQHARNQGQHNPLPHTLAHQIKEGRQNAIVRSYNSMQREQEHASSLLSLTSPVLAQIEHEQTKSLIERPFR